MADNRAQIIISAKDETQAAFRSIRGSLEGLTGLSLAGLFGGATAAGLAAAVKSAADFADEMGKAAQKVGTTTEALSGLKYAADLSDVSFEQLQTGMAKLAKTADSAAGGSKDAAEAFARIKIDPSQFADSADLFTAVAEKLSKLPDGAQKTAIAMQLLGKSGADLIPLLNAGADGIEAMRTEAERLGVTISGSTAAAAEQFNDNMTRLGAALQGMKQQLGNALLPVLAEFSESLVENSGDARKWGEDVAYGVAFAADSILAAKGVFEQFGKSIAVMFKDVATAIEVGSMIGNPISAIMNRDKIAEVLAERNRFVQAANEDMESMLASSNFTRFRDAIGKPFSGASGRTGSGNADRSSGGSGKAGKALDLDALFMEDMQLASKQLADDQKDLAKAMQAVEDAIKAQAQAWDDLNSLQQQSMDFELQGIEEASAAEQSHIESLDRRAQAYRELLDPELKLLDTQAELNEMVEAGILTSDEAAAAIKKMGEQAKDTKSFAAELGATFSSAFEDAIASGKDFSDVLTGLAQDIERLLVRRTITDPIMKGIDGLISNSGIEDFFSDIFGGFRASGGPVNVGKAYVVGERGPELFMPSTSGSIVPNGAGGSSGVVVNLIESSGNGGQVSQSTDSNGTTTIDIMVEQIEQKMNRNISRGTGIAPTIESMYGLNRAVGAFR